MSSSRGALRPMPRWRTRSASDCATCSSSRQLWSSCRGGACIEASTSRNLSSADAEASASKSLPLTEDHMAANTLNILKPSVNNLTVRIFTRAAGLECEEVDVWGKTTTPEYLQKYPAHLTPMLEEEELPKGTLGESCAIMAYLCNKHGLDQFYPRDPARR